MKNRNSECYRESHSAIALSIPRNRECTTRPLTQWSIFRLPCTLSITPAELNGCNAKVRASGRKVIAGWSCCSREIRELRERERESQPLLLPPSKVKYTVALSFDCEFHSCSRPRSVKRCASVTEVRKWRGKSRDKRGWVGGWVVGRSYTRAKHGKAISVQPRFLVSAKGIFFPGRRGRIYTRVCVPHLCVREKKRRKRMNSTVNRLRAHTAEFLPRVSALLRIIPQSRKAYRRSSWNLTSSCTPRERERERYRFRCR